jgi:hypothetical protein
MVEDHIQLSKSCFDVYDERRAFEHGHRSYRQSHEVVMSCGFVFLISIIFFVGTYLNISKG